jgi:hypothetical protein
LAQFYKRNPMLVKERTRILTTGKKRERVSLEID